MDRTVLVSVDPVSTTPSVTMSTVSVYRGVVLDTRETSVQKVYQMLICPIINCVFLFKCCSRPSLRDAIISEVF